MLCKSNIFFFQKVRFQFYLISVSTFNSFPRRFSSNFQHLINNSNQFLKQFFPTNVNNVSKNLSIHKTSLFLDALFQPWRAIGC